MSFNSKLELRLYHHAWESLYQLWSAASGGNNRCRPSQQSAARRLALVPYTAFRVQSLGDIMAITKQLRSADYYLLIDFARRQDRPGSAVLLVHTPRACPRPSPGVQEQLIALQQAGAPLKSFLQDVQSNPEPFKTTDELPQKLRELVRAKGWSASYSRDLIVTAVSATGLLAYGDHADASMQVAWQAQIENRRPDVAAVGTVCYS